MPPIFRSVHLIILLYFCISYASNNIQLLAYAVYFALLFNMAYAVLQFKKRFVFLCFNLTFFTFLVSQMMLSDLKLSSSFEQIFTSNFSDEIKMHIFSCLFLSLISVFWGYHYCENKQHRKHYQTYNFTGNKILKLREISKKFMYFFLIFAFIENLEKAFHVQQAGYESYYTDFHSQLPFFVFRLAHFYELCVFLFLATLPPKKEVIKPLVIFFAIGCMSMGYGQRNGFVLNALFVAIYFVFRDFKKFYGAKDVWITRKLKYFVILGVPFLLIFLVVFGAARVNEKVDANLGVMDLILGFFYTQGTSYRIIGYDIEFANQFPSSFPYSLGYFVDLYQQNYFFKLLGVYPTYESHTMEAALYGHNYGDVITYLFNSTAYLNGAGLGSCYIAEIYHDFRFFGVIVLNMLYGVIMASLNRYALKSVWTLFLFFCVILNVLYAPRAAALTFLSEIVTISFILFFFVMKNIYNKHENRTYSIQKE